MKSLASLGKIAQSNFKDKILAGVKQQTFHVWVRRGVARSIYGAVHFMRSIEAGLHCTLLASFGGEMALLEV